MRPITILTLGVGLLTTCWTAAGVPPHSKGSIQSSPRTGSSIRERKPGIKVTRDDIVKIDDNGRTHWIHEPVDPPSAPTCVPNPSSGIRDAHEGQMRKAADYFCSRHGSMSFSNTAVASDIIVAGVVPGVRNALDIARLYNAGTAKMDDVYDISVVGNYNCMMNGTSSIDTPIGHFKCREILHDAWKNCNNKGRGGEIEAGCFLYSIKTKY